MQKNENDDCKDDDGNFDDNGDEDSQKHTVMYQDAVFAKGSIWKPQQRVSTVLDALASLKPH